MGPPRGAALRTHGLATAGAAGAVAVLWVAAVVATAPPSPTSDKLAPVAPHFAATSKTNRTALFWVVPYTNLTSEAEYASAWKQFAANARPGYVVAGSAYAAKVNGSLGYATTPMGEGRVGVYMERWGFPVLRRMGLTTIAMVYVTHFEAIAKIVADPDPFIEQLLAKARSVGLDGFDIDYEPQEDDLTAAMAAHSIGPGDFQAFLDKLAATMAEHNLLLTIDIGGCPQFNAFACSAVPPGLTQVNTMHTFDSRSVAEFKDLAGSDGSALGEKWAPGFEPANPGPDNFGPILQAALSMGARRIATWEVHEMNVGPQPQWLFDAINAFLDAE